MSETISGPRSSSTSQNILSAQTLQSLRLSSEFSDATAFPAEAQRTLRWRREFIESVVGGLNRRWQRERRRRKVGRAYDMALEIARVIPRGSEVLDVGCGNGFIAHHLSALLGRSVVGIDLGSNAESAIDYRQYDGARFPAPDKSFNAVTLCYVLHHAQDVRVVLNEMRRVLRDGGLAVIYEDIPQSWWDRGVCWIHNQQWRERTGRCTFRLESECRTLFNSFDFEIVSKRSLSRWRNLAHPVRRKFYVLKQSPIYRACPKGSQASALSAGSACADVTIACHASDLSEVLCAEASTDSMGRS
jgi:ubiquinone/menaquinone biosynthesis C-methylase UbiE